MKEAKIQMLKDSNEIETSHNLIDFKQTVLDKHPVLVYAFHVFYLILNILSISGILILFFGIFLMFNPFPNRSNGTGSFFVCIAIILFILYYGFSLVDVKKFISLKTNPQSISAVKKYFNNLKKMKACIKMRIQCFHYEEKRDKRRFLFFFKSKKKKVVTFERVKICKYKSWEDNSIEYEGLDERKCPGLVRVNSFIKFECNDKETADSLRKKRDKMVSRYKERDEFYKVEAYADIDGTREPFLMGCSNVMLLPLIYRWYSYVISVVFCFGFTHRFLYDMTWKEINVVITKKISRSENLKNKTMHKYCCDFSTKDEFYAYQREFLSQHELNDVRCSPIKKFMVHEIDKKGKDNRYISCTSSAPEEIELVEKSDDDDDEKGEKENVVIPLCTSVFQNEV